MADEEKWPSMKDFDDKSDEEEITGRGTDGMLKLRKGGSTTATITTKKTISSKRQQRRREIKENLELGEAIGNDFDSDSEDDREDEGPFTQMQFESPVMAPSTKYESFMELKTLSFTVKLTCALHLVFLMYWFFLPSFEWMIAFGIFTLCGFYGAMYFRSKFVLIYVAYLVLNLLFLIIFLFVSLSEGEVRNANTIAIFGFVLILAEVLMIHYTYQFWKKLPYEDFKSTFSNFVGDPSKKLSGLFTGLGMTEDDENGATV
eukprot:TRINITY_DN2564_c0_g1_i1.p1 TRINITY_DN2564_c0_g1~~TRINITY_DN2564_c0_g1_i1.p1  ORF type:complete len:260 (-),score=45.16 TRINITY_DN2564_c0_g1_i1:83-862(-)